MPEDDQQSGEQPKPETVQSPQNAELNQPQDNSTTVSSPPQPVQPLSSAPNNNQGNPKKAKLLIIITVALLVIGGGVAAFWFWQSSDSENGEEQAFSSGQENIETAPAISDEPAVLSELDRVFGEYVVTIARDDMLPVSYENTHYFYNDEGNFALSDAEHNRYYQLDFHDSTAFRESNWDCGLIHDRHSNEIAQLRSAFTDNGYEITNISPYRQDENCQDAFIAENETMSCSAGFYLGPDVTGQTENSMGGPGGAEFLTVSCKSRANLESEIADARILHEAVTTAALYDFGPNEQLRGKPVFLEASNPDHTIIEHQVPGYTYYYTYEGNWYRASFFDGIPCSFDGPDAEREREVFLGQECFDPESQTRSAVQ